jgi:NAD(P)-dependent dehydrogenase (short-subunit alcohol dehydrogenase family)
MNIVITGASRGIGYQLAKVFAKTAGNKIFAVARNSDSLLKLQSEILDDNPECDFSFLAFNLLSAKLKTELIPEIKTHLGTVDVLINNAGAIVNKAVEELTDKDFDTVFGVNVKAVFNLTRELLPLFNENAHIVNLSSMGGVQGSAKFPGLSLYSASKAAVAVLSECLAEEFKERKIKVNALAIGAVQTEMLEEAFPGYIAPLTPHEMAEFIADFAINGHRFFNGKILPVSLSTP